MKLVVTKNLEKNNYEVTLEITDINQEDKELLSDFGEPVINIGGAITEDVVTTEQQEVEVDDGMGGTTTEIQDVDITTTTTIADLGSTYRKLPSEFPIKKVFTKGEFGDDAEKVANLYVDKIEADLKEALESLRAKTDNFSKVEEILL